MNFNAIKMGVLGAFALANSEPLGDQPDFGAKEDVTATPAGPLRGGPNIS